MKTKLIAIILTMVCYATASMAKASFDRAGLDQMFSNLESGQRMMGSVLITKDGEPIYSRELGYGNMASKTKSDSQTMFRIGSITKTFTATLIFRLIEEQKLSLNTKLSKFYPQLANADQITIAHLLSHTSGLPNFPFDVDFNDPKAWVFHAQSRSQMLARFLTMKPIFNPGEKRQYSNTNFVLLGYIVESVAGTSYNQYLNENIIKKINLTRTRVGGKINNKNNEAFSYAWNDAKWNRSLEQNLSIAGGAGSLVSTNADLAKFIHTLFTSDKILRQSSQVRMTTPFIPSLENSTLGIGVGVLEIGNIKKKIFQHDGGVDEFMSLLTYVPEDKLAISILINGHNYPIRKIFRTLFSQYYAQPTAIPAFKAIQLSDVALEGFVGSYNFAEIGMTISIKKGKANLIAQANGQDSFIVEPISAKEFAHNGSGIIIEFKNNPDGSEYFDLYQQKSSMRFLKQPLK